TVAWAHSWEAGPLPAVCLHSPEEGRHRLVQPEVDLVQEFAIDEAEVWVVLFARLKCGFGISPPRPPFAGAQAHHPPVVQAATLALHKLQGLGVSLAYLESDLGAEQHRESPSCTTVARTVGH